MARTQLLAIHKRADSFYQSVLDCSYTQTCGVATYRLKKLSQLLRMDLDKIITEHTAYRNCSETVGRTVHELSRFFSYQV